MKKGCILCLLISVISLPLIAQNIIYSNLKELLAQHGDTTAVLRVEKRSRNQIVLTCLLYTSPSFVGSVRCV